VQHTNHKTYKFYILLVIYTGQFCSVSTLVMVINQIFYALGNIIGKIV